MSDAVFDRKTEYLGQYRMLAFEVERLAERARYWRQKAVSLSPPDPGLLGIRGGVRSDIGDFVSKFLDLASECAKAGQAAEAKRREIEESLGSVSKPEHRELLKFHYLDGFTLLESAERMGYSLDWAYHNHRDAVNSFKLPDSVQTLQ